MKYSLTTFILFSIFFVSCGEKSMKGLAVPHDVVSVIHVNGSSINSKASWQEIGVANWFGNEPHIINDSSRRKLLNDPELSGIDIKSDFILFTRNKSNISYRVFEGFLKDANAFETVAKRIHPGIAVEKEDDFKFLKVDADKLITWSNSKFIFIAGKTVANPRMNRNRVQENLTLPGDSLISFANALYNLTEGQSLEKINSYAALIKESADVHMWSNSTLTLSGMGGGPFALLSASPLMQDNFSTTTINFENGKILATSKFLFGEALSRVMEKHEVPNLTKDAFNRIPSKDVAGVLAWNFNPETIREFFTAAGINPDNFLKQYGTSLDPMVKSTNGQLLFSVIPLTEKKPAPDLENPLSMMPMPLDLNALLAISVKDKTSFEQLITVLKGLFIGEERAAQLTIPYKINNEWFAIGTSTKQVDSFMLGANYSHAFADKITGDPVGGYVDIKKLIATAPAEMADSAQISLAKNTWEYIVIKGGRYKDRSMSLHTEINFADKSTNSLKQLGKFLSGMRMLEEQKSGDRNRTAIIH